MMFLYSQYMELIVLKSYEEIFFCFIPFIFALIQKRNKKIKAAQGNYLPAIRAGNVSFVPENTCVVLRTALPFLHSLFLRPARQVKLMFANISLALLKVSRIWENALRKSFNGALKKKSCLTPPENSGSGEFFYFRGMK